MPLNANLASKLSNTVTEEALKEALSKRTEEALEAIRVVELRLDSSQHQLKDERARREQETSCVSTTSLFICTLDHFLPCYENAVRAPRHADF